MGAKAKSAGVVFVVGMWSLRAGGVMRLAKIKRTIYNFIFSIFFYY
jgi:hypothetical protein